MFSNNKKKIINDPVYGFINIPSDLIFDILSHPHFQRLRRIKQLGLTHYVYPGATHTRFEHVLGATHLMNSAIEILISKGNNITKEEKEAALIAILMHDIGHGPFSHTLEHSIVQNISHEELTLLFMEEINKELNGKLSLGIEIFKNTYHKKFLHSLVSGQLDVDRLDYLKRDSFYTGVSEGVIGLDRIIKMLNIINNDIVVEEKGMYSIENFLVSRRIMYWQVYLHKTVVSAEIMLVKILERAKLESKKNGVYATSSLKYFFDNSISDISFFEKNNSNSSALNMFAKLDDSDILVSIKEWMNHSDFVLSELSRRLINRDLLRVEILSSPIEPDRISDIENKTCEYYNIDKNDVKFLVFSGKINNKAYSPDTSQSINILNKKGKISDIVSASDLSNIAAMSENVEKYYICYPKECLSDS